MKQMLSGCFRFLLIAVPVILGIALSTSSVTKAKSGELAITDITLGMDIDSVLKIFPSAAIEARPPSCYSYGTAVWNTAAAGRVLRRRDDISELTLSFASPRKAGRLIRIDYDRRVDPATFDFGKLVERLAKRHGPYDRTLHRRKMEPAGRIIGFEWLVNGRASLRVALHEDFRTPDDRYRLSYFARSTAAIARQKRCASSRCSPCIAP